MNWFKRILTPPLIVLAAILMWIEEFLWKWLKALTSLIALIPLIQRLEAAIAGLPPHWAIVVFFLPMTALFPVKVLAVYWLARGYWLASLILIALAKVLGTAIEARLFMIYRPQLMTIEWFRRLHDFVIATRDWLYESVRQLPLYIAARRFLDSVKQSAKNLVAKLKARRRLWQRWRAIRRWQRQKAAEE